MKKNKLRIDKLYIATTNAGKLKEISAAFENVDIKLIPLEIDFDKLEDHLKVSGVTDMAVISSSKAMEAFDQIKERGLEILPVCVDDAGLYIERLGDKPGINTKSFVKENGGIEGVKRIINEGETAYFQSVLSYMDSGLSIPKCFVGKIFGTLSSKDNTISTEVGFPLNHIFIAKDQNQFMYQISVADRINFSHRFKAASLLKEYLK